MFLDIIHMLFISPHTPLYYWVKVLSNLLDCLHWTVFRAKVLHNNSNNPENVHEKAVHNFPNFILEYPKLIIRGIFQKALLMVVATNNTSTNTLQGIFKNFLNFSDLLLLTFFFFSKI